jgi:hypothetical protein
MYRMCGRRCGELLLDLQQLGIDAAQVIEECGGELAAGRLHRPGRRDRCQELGDVACCDLLADDTRGISSHSAACRRQAIWVQVRPESRRRLEYTFSTPA